jgi:hypothetical protein
MDELEMERILDQSEEELFRLIGAELLAAGPGIAEPTAEDEVEEGQDWWNTNLSLLRTHFCETQLFIEADRAAGQARWQLGLLIADAVAQHFTGVPPFAVAALLLRFGRERFCESGGGPL